LCCNDNPKKKYANSDVTIEESELQNCVPNSRNSVPNSRNCVPNSRNSVPNSGNSVPNSGNCVPNSRKDEIIINNR